MLWFAVSDAAFIGGSLVPFGGHNILEPPALQKPILSGPHYSNLKALFEPFIAEQALRIVQDSDELANTLHNLINNSDASDQLANKAYECFAKQTGALERTMNEIKPFLNS